MSLNRLTFCKRSLMFFLFLGFLLVCISSYADQITPIGTWKTIDDETGKPRSIVQIWQVNGNLRGKIQKVFYRSGEGPQDVCDKCTGSFHNQLILGMTILWDVVQRGDRWVGEILDPHNGKTYHCILTMSPDAQQLSVRGYIGIPLIGRTQIWYRVS